MPPTHGVSGSLIRSSSKAIPLLRVRNVSVEAQWRLESPPYPAIIMSLSLRCQWRPSESLVLQVHHHYTGTVMSLFPLFMHQQCQTKPAKIGDLNKIPNSIEICKCPGFYRKSLITPRTKRNST